jgi:hypothetical protein
MGVPLQPQNPFKKITKYIIKHSSYSLKVHVLTWLSFGLRVELNEMFFQSVFNVIRKSIQQQVS